MNKEHYMTISKRKPHKMLSHFDLLALFVRYKFLKWSFFSFTRGQDVKHITVTREVII